MRLSIYSPLNLWTDYLLRSPRLVTWNQSHGLGLGLDSSKSPTIHFFPLGSSSVSSVQPVAVPSFRVARRRIVSFLCAGSLFWTRGPSPLSSIARRPRSSSLRELFRHARGLPVRPCHARVSSSRLHVRACGLVVALLRDFPVTLSSACCSPFV